MTAGLVNRLPKDQGGVCVLHMSRADGMGVDEFASEREMSAAAASIVQSLAETQGKVSKVVAVSSQEKEDAPSVKPLYVVMFVTMVGWGKNQVCEGLAATTSDLASEMGLEGRWQILEGDVLASSFWPQVSAAIADPSLGLLILNRNFPPNSWDASLRRLQAASEGKRLLIPIAVVPKSTGTPTSPFSLLDFAVCLRGVQGRSGHGTQLDGSNQATASVASMFYGLYNGMGGWHDLVDKVCDRMCTTL
jgi:hypothetical protein